MTCSSGQGGAPAGVPVRRAREPHAEDARRRDDDLRLHVAAADVRRCGGQPASFGYDANGNQTSDPDGATYTYTPTNMLETASLVAGAVYTYRYDGDNQRVLKHEGSTKTTYYLRGLGQVLSEFEEQGGQAHVDDRPRLSRLAAAGGRAAGQRARWR